MSKLVIFLGLIFFGSIVLSGAVSAANYTVGPGSSYNYHNISSALAVAKDGDNIKVYPNNAYYNENIVIQHKITLTAVGKVETGPASNLDSIMIYPQGSGSTIQGFTITTAHNVAINQHNNLEGIYLSNANNCKILKNNITGFAAGISVNGNNNLISQNIINSLDNSVGYSYGIDLASYSNNTISNNTINTTGTGTGSSVGIAVYGDTADNILGNKITANHLGTGPANGILISESSMDDIIGNTIKTTNSNNNGIYLSSTSTNDKISGNSINAANGITIQNTCTNNLVNFNRIISSNMAIAYSDSGLLNAQYNWYGSNSNPSSKIYSLVSGKVNYSPWLILTLTPNPNKITTGSKSTVTADLKHDSSSGHPIHNNAFVINGIPVTFSGVTLGTITPNSSTTINDSAKTTYTAGNTTGTGKINVKVDNQTISTSILITPLKVLTTSPANNATGVSLTSSIIIKFSENISSATNYSGIYVKNLTTGKITTITKTISGNTLTIKQTSKRLSKNTYQVYIPATAIKDSTGNNLVANYTFTFKTGTV